MNIKKISALAIILILALALASCGDTPPDLEDRVTEETQENIYTYTGIIEQLEFDAYKQGTHQLNTEDEDKVIIQSQSIDLNRYIGKSVIIKTEKAKVIGKNEQVFNVIEIQFGKGVITDETENYESSLFAIQFRYPTVWELFTENGRLSLKNGEKEWVKIEVFNDQTDIDAFVTSKETEEGALITIGAQRSIRYADNDSIWVYIPNPPKKKIYKITFNKGDDESESEIPKEYFYRILESFKLIYRSVKTGDKCGGEENIKCPENYICELNSSDEKSSGICVSLNPDQAEQDCPYIAPPTECENYRVSEYSKTDCPTRYQCEDIESGLRDLEETGKIVNTDSLTGTFEKYQDTILGVEGAEIIKYEVDENTSLISVFYEYKDSNYKTIYEFSASANEFNFIEKSHSELSESDDADNAEDTEIIPQEIDEETNPQEDIPQVKSDETRLYENTHKDFSLQYPKNWYYRSFGVSENAEWVVGFADKPVDSLNDAIIIVSIVEEAPASNTYMTTKKRDDESIYTIEGPEEIKDVIDKMAESIN